MYTYTMYTYIYTCIYMYIVYIYIYIPVPKKNLVKFRTCLESVPFKRKIVWNLGVEDFR